MVDGDGVGPGHGLRERCMVSMEIVWFDREGLGEAEGRRKRTNLKSVFMLRKIKPSPLGVQSSDHSFLWEGSMQVAKFWAQLIRADSAYRM